MSLRFRLTAISVLLVALGLLGAGIATRHYLDSFLVDRVDQQFASAELPAFVALAGEGGPHGLANPPPSGSYAGLITEDGRERKSGGEGKSGDVGGGGRSVVHG